MNVSLLELNRPSHVKFINATKSYTKVTQVLIVLIFKILFPVVISSYVFLLLIQHRKLEVVKQV